VFPEIVQLLRVGAEPLSQCTPPPWYCGEFPEIVQLVRVGEEFDSQNTPLPEFREIVQFVRFGEEFDLQNAPAPKLSEIVQLVISGLSPNAIWVPPAVPFVIIRFEREEPVRRQRAVPSMTVLSSPSPKRLTWWKRSKSSAL
jgi:hypothetical protein